MACAVASMPRWFAIPLTSAGLRIGLSQINDVYSFYWPDCERLNYLKGEGFLGFNLSDQNPNNRMVRYKKK